MFAYWVVNRWYSEMYFVAYGKLKHPSPPVPEQSCSAVPRTQDCLENCVICCLYYIIFVSRILIVIWKWGATSNICIFVLMFYLLFICWKVFWRGVTGVLIVVWCQESGNSRQYIFTTIEDSPYMLLHDHVWQSELKSHSRLSLVRFFCENSWLLWCQYLSWWQIFQICFSCEICIYRMW